MEEEATKMTSVMEEEAATENDISDESRNN